jgi:hypothetical protein
VVWIDLLRGVVTDVLRIWIDLNDPFALCAVSDRVVAPKSQYVLAVVPASVHVVFVVPGGRASHVVTALGIEEARPVDRRASLWSAPPARTVHAAAVAAGNEHVGAIFFAVVASPAIAAFAVANLAERLVSARPMVPAVEAIARVALCAESIGVRFRAAGKIVLN